MELTPVGGVCTLYWRWVPPGRCDGQTACLRLMAPVPEAHVRALRTGAILHASVRTIDGAGIFPTAGRSLMIGYGLLVALGAVLILGGCELFTRGLEAVGEQRHLTDAAVGSLLAAVGTALPETLIPVIALASGADAVRRDVGLGAILGAPFLLATLGFSLFGGAVLICARRGRRPKRIRIDRCALRRDLLSFCLTYGLAIGAAFVGVRIGRLAIALLLLAYGFYCVRTWRHRQRAPANDSAAIPLKSMRHAEYKAAAGLAAILAGARLFVQALVPLARVMGVSAFVLSVLITPLVTELPEKFNSVLWVRRDRDTLALGNITGAMVFQSSVPTAVGIAMTDWQLSTSALVSAGLTLACTGLVVGQLVIRGRLGAPALLVGGLGYILFLIYLGFVGLG